VPDEHAHDMTLRLVKQLAQKLSEDRRQDILLQHDLLVRLFGVSNEESALQAAQELLRDALSV
jgi:hypothetical protein